MTEYLLNYKVENFLNSDFVKDLVKISIIKNPDGSYDLFDKYVITSKNKKYIVETKHAFDSYEFYSLQNAVTYCIFSQKNRYTEAQRIYNLDKIIEGVNFSITGLQSKLIKNTSLESIMIYTAKLSQDEAKRQNLLKEMSSYRKQANYWQTNEFRV